MTNAGANSDDQSPLVSVILPVRNGEPYLSVQLCALAAQSCGFSWEMIVVDNGSTDSSADTARMASSRFKNFRLLSESRAGKSRALNTGRTAASGRYLLILDADDEVGEHYIERLSTSLDKFDLVGGRVDGGRFNPWDEGELPPLDRLVPFLDFLPSFAGASLGVRAAVWDAVGGFNEDLLSAEDIDFSWRVQLAGFTAELVPDAVLHYRRPLTAKDNFLKARSYGRSHVWLYQRFHQLGQPRRSLRVALSHVRDALVEARRHEDHWQWRAAWHLGLVEGRLEESLRQRIWYP